MADYRDLPHVRGELLQIRPGRRLSVAYQAGGDSVVFFGHGGGGNKDQWRELWRELGRRGYSLVAWDLLGHGASDRPNDPRAYAWNELVADELEVLRRFGGQRNVIVAHSFGTGLALSALLAGPAVKIEAALLLGSQLHRPLKRKGLLNLPVWVLEFFRPRLARGFRQAAWHPKADPALVAYEDGLAQGNSLRVFKALVAHARWPDSVALTRLEVPIAVVAGDRDGLTPAQGGEELARQLPQATFRVLENCGHQLMLEKPGEVLEAFEGLLARVDLLEPVQRV
ncbi:alpha/beta fold hydrolase [Pseudomonas sp. S75]|uniref:alpha/beta fold hydrolase n=1 Tax=unclassified Pseudomonas TaxID=196821 RepID=UPI001903D900|nr:MULTISPECIES: alpha/beta hydrolase [unclassified Pseudomonas]MBJ9975077.1 alpha/beta fold hydrolase [Pseudomonas sp. S30]MBK0152914.1 alpha/beta fold hydrolase [Pseudomonas sp. S75]